MFRPQNTKSPSNYRLPKMQKILSEGDLQFILSEAQRRTGTTIEMPFLNGQQSMMLTVVITPQIADPVWTFYVGDDASAKTLWQHPTGDVNLVLSLAATHIGRDDVEFRSTSKTDGMPSHIQKSQDSRMSNTFSNLQPLSNGEPVDVPSNMPPSPKTTQGGNPSLGGKAASLEGDLSNMQVPTLLQSISMSKMTGKLHLQDKGQQAYIYFFDGAPTHAVTDESTGDSAIVEMITWEEGQFHFYPQEQSQEKSVKRRVDSMLMEGVTVLDQNKYLKEQGLSLSSYLFRKNPAMTEDDFKLALSKGAPLDLETQKRFYTTVDGAVTMLDMLRKIPMVKLEWVPIMFNMLSCGILGVSDTPPAGVTISPVLTIPPFPIDQSAIAAVARTLVRPETNIFTYPAFLYFLQQEFAKCSSMGMPLSVVVFDLALRIGHEAQPMPVNFANQVLRRMEQVKRPFDTLGHFETFGYALFMPNTPLKGAKVFGVRLVELLGQDSGIPKVAGSAAVTMGIASAPEDTLDLPLLLSAAKEAKTRAAHTGSSVVLFKEPANR